MTKLKIGLDIIRGLLALSMTFGSTELEAAADVLPPLPPIGLTATAATCGQVDLSWNAATDELGGSGLKAYVIHRDDGVNSSIAIGAVRTAFSDTNYVKSSTTLSYYVVATDNAGNQSSPSNSVSVTTPPCPISSYETVIDGAYMAPLGKNMATYGDRTVLMYIKQNPLTLTWDNWLYVSDSDTGQTSRFLLHSSPGYNQIETDYLLASATELWTLSHNSEFGGNLLVSQYRLNGSPPTSATLISAKSLGDTNSFGKSMIRLQSGALMVAWNEEGWNYRSAQDLTSGYAYRSVAGNWAVKFPVTVPGSGITMSQMIMAQHPGDGSIWAFVKRDSFAQISALHFFETANDFVVDWIKTDYITYAADGDNGPEGEFPFLTAAADPTRNAILLAYQSYRDRVVFVDPLYGNGNMIFLKEAPATIALIKADATKTFIPFPTYMERGVQFGMSALADGTIWLAYQPIDSQTLTWNQVYASKYQDGAWSAPVLTGLNYSSYNVASAGRDPGLLIYRTDQPQVAFLTPDQEIHSLTLSDTAPPPSTPDILPPTVFVTSPVNNAIVTGNITLSASAADNVGVTKVDFLIDGAVVGAVNSLPSYLPWNSTAVADGTHSLQCLAYDAARNMGSSPPVNFTVRNLSVVITTPTNGATVPRNQKVTIGATATDSVAVTKVEFYVNNSLLGTATAVPYGYPWRVPGKKGQYKIQAKAYDAAGKSAAHAITVTAK